MIVKILLAIIMLLVLFAIMYLALFCLFGFALTLEYLFCKSLLFVVRTAYYIVRKDEEELLNRIKYKFLEEK